MYLDASAVVKTIREKEEEGAAALRGYLQGADLISARRFVTYDKRQTAVARLAGLHAVSRGAAA
ncbi:MAG TPA: hypothetical protein VFN85_10330 [Solirubrobacterales bacterium]|nr:hypothetical protein [Solirubrobacterales bacterium]